MFLRRSLMILCLLSLLTVGWLQPVPAQAATGRYFSETGFWVHNLHFLDYYDHRGGVRSFGYPVSREFTFLGFPVQFFQRAIMQQYPDGRVTLMNLLDNGLFPYTSVNGAIFPSVDQSLIKTAPKPGTMNYADQILSYVDHVSPNSWKGLTVNFLHTFMSTVSLADVGLPGRNNLLAGFNLEIWGVPTSLPSFDPHNSNFVYQRFQRGILHYDRTNGVTQGLLLADYFKDVLMGVNLPPDLASEAAMSPYYHQYNPLKPNWVDRPASLPSTNLTRAFEASPIIAIDPGHGGSEIGASHTFPDGTVLAEKNLNLQVATETTQLLRQAGYQVVQTRTTDSHVNVKHIDFNHDGKVDLADDLQARINIANAAHATLFLSIHFNGDSDPSLHGTEAFYCLDRPFYRQNIYFAQLVDQDAVAALSALGYHDLNLGARSDASSVGAGNHLYVLGPDAKPPTAMPGALVEGLFLTNAADAAQLRNPRTLDALAHAYALAVEQYYGDAP